MTSRWQHFHHQSDIGVRGIADTLGGAFEQAALALTAVVTDPAGVTSGQEVTIRCEAPDPELLLVDWLNAVIYEMAVRGMVFGRFAVRIDGLCLKAEAWGEGVEVARHVPTVEVKGATYSALRVSRSEAGEWMAQTVVDV